MVSHKICIISWIKYSCASIFKQNIGNISTEEKHLLKRSGPTHSRGWSAAPVVPTNQTGKHLSKMLFHLC